MNEPQYAAYLEELRGRFPRLKLVDKVDSPMCKAIDAVLRVVTMGGQSTFMTRYVTTIGSRIYLPTEWPQRSPVDRYCVMRHEAVHLEQFRRYGLIGMTLLYVLVPIPLGFAGGRAWLEWEAYKETVRVTWDVHGPEAARSPGFRDEIVRRFTGPDYGWMWLRGTTVDNALQRLLTELEMTHSTDP